VGPRLGQGTMTTEQVTLFAILCALFALLAWGRWRYDVVAFLALILGHAPGERATKGQRQGKGGCRFHSGSSAYRITGS
ncbi:MAG: hypothetical protein V3R15_07765, partial [Qipengyuania citrea]